MKPKHITGCKHRGTWIIGSGSYEWCYECGAFRCMKPDASGPNVLKPSSPWVHPTGVGGENPHHKWYNAKQRWEEKHK